MLPRLPAPAPVPRRGTRASRGWLLAVALALWGTGFTVLARAETSTSLDLARTVAVAGREAYNAGDYETARDLFRRAYAIHPVPTLSLYEARSLAHLGHLQEATAIFERTASLPIDASSPQQFAEAVASARQEQQALVRRLPSLTVHVRGANDADREVRVTLNQHDLQPALLGRRFPVDPGTHVLEAVANDGRRDRIEIALAEGRHIDAVLDVSTSSGAAPADGGSQRGTTAGDRRPTLAYASLGLGIAGVGTGIVTGIMAGSKHSEATRLCPAGNCEQGSRGADALDSFHALRTTSTIAYGVGAAGLTAGVILWLSLPSSQSNQVSAFRPWFSARYAGIQGAFQ